ncbi:MAG: alpha/beta hydrolase domain-containing protein, partial [Actinomycetota bacterium]
PLEALQQAGYVDQEFFVSGTANVYDWDADNNPVVRTPDALYTTRIIVRRPADVQEFNGTVWVEPLNPTLLIDLDRMWQLHYAQILREGDAYVGITSKPVTIASLKKFDPVRYAPLSMANPLPLDDPLSCESPGSGALNTATRETEDGLIWDIMSQVGAVLKSAGSQNPLGAPARFVYGEGWSQTGGYALRYFSTIGPLAKLADGSPVYDGWLTGGATAPADINQCSFVESAADPRNQIRPNGVPVISIRTQGDFFSLEYRPDDSDPPGERYRLYELAGPTHDTASIFQNFPPDADIIASGVTPPNPSVCGYKQVTDFPYEYYFNAAAENLKLWSDGFAPPHGDRFQYDFANPNHLDNNVKDQYGNAVGGVRSPYLDVPIATYTMGTPGEMLTCMLLGQKVPFDKDVLRQLYPSHDDYVARVTESTMALVKDRFLLQVDAEKIIAEASHRGHALAADLE